MRISVVIVTHNRRDDLRNTIKAFENQTYPDKEIIIIDNASQDGTKDMMNEEFPYINYTWLPDNFDIRAINIGIEFSTGDIIWRTDDDSYPESPEAFERIVNIFLKYPDIHIIASQNVEVSSNYTESTQTHLELDRNNIPEKGYKYNYFPGTGAGIRREVINKIGGFWGFGFEEIDFCTRAIASGFNIRFFPDLRVLHFSSPGGKTPDWKWVRVSQQLIRYQWKYFPFFRALGRSLQFFTAQIFFGILNRVGFAAFMEGIFGMISSAFMAYRAERQVLPPDKLKDVTLGIS
ncbi:MAG: glycosyltransferase family 2 protein, partial [Bacteroidota bacterium]